MQLLPVTQGSMACRTSAPVRPTMMPTRCSCSSHEKFLREQGPQLLLLCAHLGAMKCSSQRLSVALLLHGSLVCTLQGRTRQVALSNAPP